MNTYLLLNIVGSIVPEHDAIVFEGRRYTFNELTERVGKLATALEKSGVKQGDRIAIIATNCPEMIETFFAAFQLGAGVVPINYRARQDEMEFMLADSGADILVIENRYLEQLRPYLAAEHCPIRQTIAIGSSAFTPYEYEHFISEQTPMMDVAEVEEDGLALLLYTSGTTSKPKGVMMSYGQLTQYVMGHTESADGLSKGTYLTCVPCYHVAGATSILNSLYGGRRVVLIRQFEIDEWLNAMEHERVTHAFLVPTMMKRILDSPRFNTTDFRYLESLSYGAAPMPLPVILDAIEKFPSTVQFANAFGMTETTSTVSVLGPGDHQLTGTPQEIERKIRRLTSVGKPVDGVEVIVQRDDGSPAAINEVGHIYLRTARAMKSYWNRPDASAETVVEGWINTKDMGLIDEEGYLYLTGRNSDMIIRGGENISPQEIENVLFEHPKVADATVIGVPSIEWGEEILAIIVPRDGNHPPTLDEIRAHCRLTLASFKCPTAIELLDDLPQTSSGKILKKELRDRYAGQKN